MIDNNFTNETLFILFKGGKYSLCYQRKISAHRKEEKNCFIYLFDVHQNANFFCISLDIYYNNTFTYNFHFQCS